MLAVALKLLCVLTENPFKHVRSNYRGILVPHFVQRFGVGHHKSPFSSQRIFVDFILDECEAVI